VDKLLGLGGLEHVMEHVQVGVHGAGRELLARMLRDPNRCASAAGLPNRQSRPGCGSLVANGWRAGSFAGLMAGTHLPTPSTR
jgi:hypothetical protein